MRLVFFVLILVSTAQAQDTDFNYEDELQNINSVEFRRKVKQIIQNSPGTAQAIYLSALIESDADKSVDTYNEVINKFPKSDFAAKALFRLGQYYYAKGLYLSARTHFLRLLNNFPGNQYSDQINYFAASCLCASKEIDKCTDELKQFIATHKDSELRNLAQLDYEELRPIQQQLEVAEKGLQFNEDAKFTLQMGVFTKPNNALNYRNFFTRVNLPAVIKERKMRNKPIYFVLLGSFQDKEAAIKAGDKILKEHGKPYRIVEIK